MEKQIDLSTLAHEAACMARVLAQGADGRLCSELVLVELGDAIDLKRYAIGLQPASLAPRGELIRISVDLIHDAAARLQLCNLLRCELEPFIEGVGEVRIVGDELFEGLAILPAQPSVRLWGHLLPEGLSAETAIAAAKVIAEWEQSPRQPLDLALELFALFQDDPGAQPHPAGSKRQA